MPTIASNATALLASRALDDLIGRMPFPVKAIQVDGGSEFMAEFEDACQQKGILLFCLPPRSPKLNGRMERANRTFAPSARNSTTVPPPPRPSPASALTSWPGNTPTTTSVPHQTLGYLTPAQFLATFNANHHMQDLSRTS